MFSVSKPDGCGRTWSSGDGVGHRSACFLSLTASPTWVALTDSGFSWVPRSGRASRTAGICQRAPKMFQTRCIRANGGCRCSVHMAHFEAGIFHGMGLDKHHIYHFTAAPKSGLLSPADYSGTEVVGWSHLSLSSRADSGTQSQRFS